MLYIEIAQAGYVLHYHEAEKQIKIRMGGSIEAKHVMEQCRNWRGTTSGAKPLWGLALQVGTQVLTVLVLVPYINTYILSTYLKHISLRELGPCIFFIFIAQAHRSME